MTPTQMLSCEYYEIFKNSSFYRQPLVAIFVFSFNYRFLIVLSNKIDQCIVSHAWVMHGWSMMQSSNLILRLCLYSMESIPFLLVFCFLFRFVTFWFLSKGS